MKKCLCVHNPLLNLETTLKLLLRGNDIEIYQSLTGSMRWAISIGRWDINTTFLTLSGFRAQPRVDHFEWVKRVYAYLINFRYFTIKFNVEEPDYGDLQEGKHNWSNTPYGNGRKDVSVVSLSPKGKFLVLSHLYDANLMHDILSGKSVTGVFHMTNLTPIQRYY